jgi:broad specificity phosphatase PhoE
VSAACEELASEAARHDVVVVSHVSPIKAAVAWALGTPPDIAWRLSLSVASITRITTDASSGPALVSFNETEHLAGVEALSRQPP